LNGHKFSRQIPLGPYVADFVYRDSRLIVEIDGSQHAESAADIVRTRWLNAGGYSVLRFWNHEVLRETARGPGDDPCGARGVDFRTGRCPAVFSG
jgi:very-short-patch-repair endonuclease